jgi:hypothetical protein
VIASEVEASAILIARSFPGSSTSLGVTKTALHLAFRAQLCSVECRFGRRSRDDAPRCRADLFHHAIYPSRSGPICGARWRRSQSARFVPPHHSDLYHYVFRSFPATDAAPEGTATPYFILKTGDRVVTSAGIHGMITNVKETTVTVKVADNVKIEMEKSAVTNVLKE